MSVLQFVPQEAGPLGQSTAIHVFVQQVHKPKIFLVKTDMEQVMKVPESSLKSVK